MISDLQRLALILKKDKLRAQDIATRMRINEDATYELLDRIEQARYDLRISIEKRGRREVSWYHIKSTKDTANLVLSPRSRKKETIKMLLITDLHAGDKHFYKKGLEEVLKTAWDKDVRHCYIAGDIVAGRTVYSGQIEDLKYVDEEDQVQEAADVLANYEYTYAAITGNHDENWMKNGAPSPVKLLSDKLPDLIDLKSIQANIVIEGVLMQMVHGAGGAAYARSYPAQKYLRNLAEQGSLEQEVDGVKYPIGILHLGHYHTQAHFRLFGAHVFQAGSFQLAESSFSKRQGFVGVHGGYIVEMVTQRGKILRITPTWIEV